MFLQQRNHFKSPTMMLLLLLFTSKTGILMHLFKTTCMCYNISILCRLYFPPLLNRNNKHNKKICSRGSKQRSHDATSDHLYLSWTCLCLNGSLYETTKPLKLWFLLLVLSFVQVDIQTIFFCSTPRLSFVNQKMNITCCKITILKLLPHI